MKKEIDKEEALLHLAWCVARWDGGADANSANISPEEDLYLTKIRDSEKIDLTWDDFNARWAAFDYDPEVMRDKATQVINESEAAWKIKCIGYMQRMAWVSSEDDSENKMSDKEWDLIAQTQEALGLTDEERKTSYQTLPKKEDISKNHSVNGVRHLNIANNQKEKGDYDKAIENYQIAYDNLKKHYDTHSIKIADILESWGDVYRYKKEYDKALDLYYQSLMNKMRNNGPDSISVGSQYYTIGLCLYHKGSYDLALAYLQNTLRMEINEYGPKHNYLAVTERQIGNTWMYKGDFPKALEHYQSGIAIQSQVYGPESKELSEYYGYIGFDCQQAGYFDFSIECLQHSYQIREKIEGQTHTTIFELSDTYRIIGERLMENSEFQKAMDCFQKGKSVIEQSNDPTGHEETLQKLLAHIADCQSKLGTTTA